MSVALEYHVLADGRISTDGVYREISEQDWRDLKPPRRMTKGRYEGAVQAVAQGKIIAVPASSSKSAWTVVRSLKEAAQRKGLCVSIRRVADPARPRAELVLVRRDVDATGD